MSVKGLLTRVLNSLRWIGLERRGWTADLAGDIERVCRDATLMCAFRADQLIHENAGHADHLEGGVTADCSDCARIRRLRSAVNIMREKYKPWLSVQV